jgi:ABC-type Fe3+/spermidine/putrescine transport system ATPase subunit
MRSSLTCRSSRPPGLRVQRQAETEIALVGGRWSWSGSPATIARCHTSSRAGQRRVALARAIVIRPRVLLSTAAVELDAGFASRCLGSQRLRKLGITAVTRRPGGRPWRLRPVAVMHQGVIVQEAAPGALSPSRLGFVAQFIGGPIFCAAVAAQRPASSRGARPPARHRSEKPGSPRARPSRWCSARVNHHLHRRDGLERDDLSRTFLGEKVEYHVRVDGDTLQVTDYGAGGARVLAPGGAVTLGVPATGVWLLGGAE